MDFRAAALLIALAICSCSRREGTSFGRESDSVQRAVPSDAQLVRNEGPQTKGYQTQASWEYEVPGPVEAAKQTVRQKVPPEYELLRETQFESSYAKFDGHDSFNLTFTYGSTSAGKTSVRMTLRALPG